MPNRFNPEIPPAWHAVRFDETSFYDEEFRKKYGVGKIYGVYVADFASRTYCCEITPSYEMHFMGSVIDEWPDDDDMRVELQDAMDENDRHSERVVYYHCRTINALAKARKHAIELDEDDWRDDSESGLEAAQESYYANPVW